MSTAIICPSCNFQFEPTEALASSIREETRREFNQKWQKEKNEWEAGSRRKEQEALLLQEQKQKALQQREQDLMRQQEELRQLQVTQEAALQQKLDAQKKILEEQLAAQLQQKMRGEYEQQITLLQEANRRISRLAALTAQWLAVMYRSRVSWSLRALETSAHVRSTSPG
ncbi:MAG: hypothetical protein EBZ77_10580, partial [Chitinophagia bacterium]|nr:hypothetical protein [Chitinophagia bacterium]